MAAPAIAVERYRVEHGQGFTMPVISLTDRRAAGNRLVRFVFQRHLETVLYGRSEGSSGSHLEGDERCRHWINHNDHQQGGGHGGPRHRR